MKKYYLDHTNGSHELMMYRWFKFLAIPVYYLSGYDYIYLKTVLMTDERIAEYIVSNYL